MGLTAEQGIEDAAQEWPIIARGMKLSAIRSELEYKSRVKVATDSEKTDAEKRFEAELDEANKQPAQ